MYLELLAEFILILIVSYHSPTKLSSFIHCYIDVSRFYLELVKLMDVFKSNGYPENFINNCFNTFVDNKHRIQEKVITMPKKPLFLVLPYFTRTKLRKSLKSNLNCCK